ncbi:hypothetical protein [Luteolibacter marinus]|uniref:hypothetical protein n=1 Tax=Luteolibacter marinus TaxID=2776705 RepID=UPI0018691C8C|nr:hypothetical protein [Luteolibacter marinus]
MSFSPRDTVEGPQVVQRWKGFLSALGCQSSEKETSGFCAADRFVFPETTFRIERGDRWYGCVFDLADSKDITAGMVADHGYLAIAGSAGGSSLLINVMPDRFGWCRWLAPGWDHADPKDFDLIVTGLTGPPWEVIEDMMEYDDEYIDDVRFPRWM